MLRTERDFCFAPASPPTDDWWSCEATALKSAERPAGAPVRLTAASQGQAEDDERCDSEEAQPGQSDSGPARLRVAAGSQPVAGAAAVIHLRPTGAV